MFRFVKVLKQHRHCFFVCTSFHKPAKLPLNALHVDECWGIIVLGLVQGKTGSRIVWVGWSDGGRALVGIVEGVG